jgi:hypothetical protein
VIRAEYVERLVVASEDYMPPSVDFVTEGSATTGGPLLVLPPADERTLEYQPKWDVIVALAENGSWLSTMLDPIVIAVKVIVAELETDDPSWPPRTRPS